MTARLPWTKVRAGLVAVARGATVADAAQLAGVSKRTLERHLAEEAVVVLRDRKPRAVALTLAYASGWCQGFGLPTWEALPQGDRGASRLDSQKKGNTTFSYMNSQRP